MRPDTPKQKILLATHLLLLFFAAGLLLWFPWMISHDQIELVSIEPPTEPLSDSPPPQVEADGRETAGRDTVPPETDSLEIEDEQIAPAPTPSRSAATGSQTVQTFTPLADKQTTLFMITDAAGQQIGWESRYITPATSDEVLQFAQQFSLPIDITVNQLLELDPESTTFYDNFFDPNFIRFKNLVKRRINLDGISELYLGEILAITEKGEHLLLDADLNTGHKKVFSPPIPSWLPQIPQSQMPLKDSGVVYNTFATDALEFTSTVDQDADQEIPAEWAPYLPCIAVQKQLLITDFSEVDHTRQIYCSQIGLVSEERYDSDGQLIETLTLRSSNLIDLGENPIQLWKDDYRNQEVEPVNGENLTAWRLSAWLQIDPLSPIDPPTHPLIFIQADQPMLISARASRTLIGYNAETTAFLWDIQTLGSVFGTLARNPENGLFYFGASDKKLYAINQQGMFFDSFQAGDNILTRPVFGANTVWFGSEDGNITCIAADLDPTSAKMFNSAGPIASSPVVWNDIAIFGSDSGIIVAVDGDCAEIWRYDAGDPIDAPLTIDEAGVVYFAGLGQMGALNGETGSELWARDLLTSVHTQPALSQSSLFVVDGFGVLHAFGRNDGQSLWTNGDLDFVGSPLVLDEQLLVNSDSNQIVLLTLDGEFKTGWSPAEAFGLPEDFETGIPIFSPVLGNGAVWIIDDLGIIYQLAPPAE